MRRERFSVTSLVLSAALPVVCFGSCVEDDSLSFGSGAISDTDGSVEAGGSGGQGADGTGGTPKPVGSGGSAGQLGGSGGGGAAGGAGSAGAGGSAGNLGSAGSMGSAGASGAGGSDGGPPESCSGCARLSIAMRAREDTAFFKIELDRLIDFTGAVITARVSVHSGTRGTIAILVQQGQTPDGGPGEYLQNYGAYTEVSQISGWQDLVWDLGINPNHIQITKTLRLGIAFQGSDSLSSSAYSPVVIYLDSIRVANIASFDFDTESSIWNAFNGAPTGSLWLDGDDPFISRPPPPGSQVTWLGP